MRNNLPDYTKYVKIYPITQNVSKLTQLHKMCKNLPNFYTYLGKYCVKIVLQFTHIVYRFIFTQHLWVGVKEDKRHIPFFVNRNICAMNVILKYLCIFVINLAFTLICRKCAIVAIYTLFV